MHGRKGFHHVVSTNERLIEALQAAGPDTAVDIDNAAQRVTLDVIGQVGFGKDFGATTDLVSNAANTAIDLMYAGRFTKLVSCPTMSWMLQSDLLH